MRRYLAVVVATLMATMPLGACYFGPDPIQYAALAVVDGRPTAVVAMCGGLTASIDVYRNDKNDMSDELHEWSVTVTLSEPVEDVEVELLGAARSGWEITTTHETVVGSGLSSFTVVPLTSIEPGHRYTLDSSELGPEGSSAPTVTFTTDDLSTIGDGQVRAPVDHEHSKVISRHSFVAKRCR